MSRLREALANLPGVVFADLLESDEAYLFVVDLPGATAETTEVRADDGRLSIEARREKDVPEGFRYDREERPTLLDAEVPLPPDADGEAASASIERGVLEVRVPKQSPGRRVPIE